MFHKLKSVFFYTGFTLIIDDVEYCYICIIHNTILFIHIKLFAYQLFLFQIYFDIHTYYIYIF